MAHKGNHICLYRFSFIYVMDNLWEDAYICPVNVMNRTTESAIYVMELWLLLSSAVWSLEVKAQYFSAGKVQGGFVACHNIRVFLFVDIC